MNDYNNERNRLEDAERASDLVSQAIRQAMHEGISLQTALAGAHAQIVGEATAMLGGRKAAAMLEAAANRVRDMPSASAYALAFSAPLGRA